MAFSPTELYAEVLLIIAEQSNAGVLTSRGWLVTNVLQRHPLKRPSKRDPDDFSVCCRQLAVATAVDSALARLKHANEGHTDPDAIELDLPRLPGYKHLRRIYPIRRDEVIFLVPLEKMTDDEINAKIKVYNKASDGFAAHARELQRYLTARKRAA